MKSKFLFTYIASLIHWFEEHIIIIIQLLRNYKSNNIIILLSQIYAKNIFKKNNLLYLFIFYIFIFQSFKYLKSNLKFIITLKKDLENIDTTKEKKYKYTRIELRENAFQGDVGNQTEFFLNVYLYVSNE